MNGRGGDEHGLLDLVDGVGVLLDHRVQQRAVEAVRGAQNHVTDNHPQTRHRPHNSATVWQ